MTRISRNLSDRARAKIEPITLTPEQLKEIGQSLAQFSADHVFIDDHQVEWTLKYPDRWVVVRDRKLVGYGKDRRRLFQSVRNRGVDLSSAAVRFLSTKPRKWILLKAS